MKIRVILPVILLLLFCGFAIDGAAQTKVRVRFARGATSATVRGSITGYKYVDYIVGSRAGQTLTGKVTSAEPSLEFLVFKPDMENVEGMVGEDDWSGQLPVDGNYTIRVIMPRSQARRHTTAKYQLTVTVN